MSFDSVVDIFRYPGGGSVGTAFAGTEVATPEISFVEVDVAGTAVSTGCVLGAASASLASVAEDAPALSISSRESAVAASVADDTTSLLDVSLLSADLLSLSDTLDVRTAAASDSPALLVACVVELSAVSAAVAVAAVAVFCASLVV